MLRIVLDTDVMVAAFRSAAGASRQLLLWALDGRFAYPVSTPLLLEYEAVLLRQGNLAGAALTESEVLAVLDQLARMGTPITFHYRWRPLSRDFDDDFVLETAINGSADLIASFNLRDLSQAAARFGIEVMRPAQALRRMQT